MAIRPRKPKRKLGPVGGPKPRQKTKIGKTIKPKLGLPVVGMPGAVNKFIKSLGLTAAQQLKLKKQMKQVGGMPSSDALKATASMIKSQKTQSKGPVGKVIKKKKR
jgi:hypothetical protein